MTPRRSWHFPALTALIAVVYAWPVSASSTIEYAKQVGYFSAPVSGAYQWHLECLADQPSVKGAVAIASGTVHDDGWMPGFIHLFRRWSDEGTLVQVGDHQLVIEPRMEETVVQSSTFGASGSWSGGGSPGTAYVAWALWGSSATCSASVSGAPVTARYLGGEHAYYVGPEAFSTGLHAESSGVHASVARTFSSTLSGGPLFASLELGQTGQGLFVSDNPYRQEIVEDCGTPNGNSCDYTRPAVHEVTVTVASALEADGGYQGELWIITLPDDQSG